MRPESPRKSGGGLTQIGDVRIEIRLLFGGMLLPDEAKGPEWNMQKRRRILEAITAREMEFIRLVCCREQPPYKKMAELMGVSEHTVEGYFKDLKRKLNITCKTGLCLFAMAWGLVPCYRWGNDPDGPEGEGDPAGDGPAVAA